MAQTTFSVRMDSEVKKQFDEFCSQVGMNTTVAFNLFVRAVLREKRLPFEIALESDPFYSDGNLAHLRRGVAALNEGKGLEHGMIEAPLRNELTVSQVADVLGFSEQHVDGLLDAGRIDFRIADGDRMILRNSLLAYARRLHGANAAVDEMVRLSEEMGLYDD